MFAGLVLARGLEPREDDLVERHDCKSSLRKRNGDIWRLIRDPGSGLAMVEHRPNVSSGGRTSLIEIGQFLRAGGNGPEHQALLRMIGTLVDD